MIFRDITPIMDNQMNVSMEHEIEPGGRGGGIARVIGRFEAIFIHLAFSPYITSANRKK